MVPHPGGEQRALALGALWVQPALEDRSNLAFCLVNFVLQLLLLTPDVECLMEGRPFQMLDTPPRRSIVGTDCASHLRLILLPHQVFDLLTIVRSSAASATGAHL